MIGPPRRLLPLAVFAILVSVFLLFRHISPNTSWRASALQKVGLGEAVDSDGVTIITPGKGSPFSGPASPSTAVIDDSPSLTIPLGQPANKAQFTPGVPKPPGSNYTKMLITPRTQKEKDKAKWIFEHFPQDGTSNVNVSMYIADDPWAPLHPPKNKGHEVMIYLTYIIDHYDSLSDVNIFMHNHQKAWHNDDLLDQDSAQMIKRLSAERVQREGYMNLRCHWHPGCPDWMHPGETKMDVNKQEEVLLAKSWSELFPMDEIPDVLAQPCCAQFALSRDRIRQLPLARYVFFRDWLLRTPLSDALSGRVWEYVWHYLFTGQNVVCPKEHICYCDGFGVCFGGEQEYNNYWKAVHELSHAREELKEWKKQAKKIKDVEEGKIDEADSIEVPKFGRDKELIKKINRLVLQTRGLKEASFKRGDNPEQRAKEVGRPWKEGDGF